MRSEAMTPAVYIAEFEMRMRMRSESSWRKAILCCDSSREIRILGFQATGPSDKHLLHL